MVQIQRPSTASQVKQNVAISGGLCIILLVVVGYAALRRDYTPDNGLRFRPASSFSKPSMVFLVDELPMIPLSQRMTHCPYVSLDDLSDMERHPKSSPKRHMVNPPQGGVLTLVCCASTVGMLNIAVHHKWAPHGAKRFIEMVKEGYFSSNVPLMRCVKNFICQFGLAGNPALNARFRDAPLLDDPNWLPEGPEHKQNAAGVKRFAKGYMTYAGNGPNSRTNQLVVGLADSGPLAGGSPAEVPWGELVGTHSFATIDKIYTGYGEDGPSQSLLGKEGASANVRAKFPLLDYITACEVIDEEVQAEM